MEVCAFVKGWARANLAAPGSAAGKILSVVVLGKPLRLHYKEAYWEGDCHAIRDCHVWRDSHLHSSPHEPHMTYIPFVPPNFEIPPVLETEQFRPRMLSFYDVEKAYEAVLETQALFHAICLSWPREGCTIKED